MRIRVATILPGGRGRRDLSVGLRGRLSVRLSKMGFTVITELFMLIDPSRALRVPVPVGVLVGVGVS